MLTPAHADGAVTGMCLPYKFTLGAEIMERQAFAQVVIAVRQLLFAGRALVVVVVVAFAAWRAAQRCGLASAASLFFCR